MTELMKKGAYPARAREWGLGVSKTGTEQVGVMFEILSGEYAGKRRTWYGFFTDKTVDRTLESLEHCGWNGESIKDLSGLDRNEVSIVVDHEEDQDGNLRERIRWVNSQGGLALKDKLDLGGVQALESRIKGKMLARKQERKNRGEDAGEGDDSFNF